MRIDEIEQPQYYYHGTDPASAQRILQHGFDPDLSRYDRKLYLTVAHREASKYGKIANNGALGTVLQIDARGLDPAAIHSNYGGIIEYTGRIAPEHVRKI